MEFRNIRTQKEAVRENFDALAVKYAQERELQYSFIIQKNIVLKFLTATNCNVLDIGSGPGVMIEELIHRGCRVWCVDISEEMIWLAANKLAGTGYENAVCLSVGDIEELEFPNEYFDAIICMGVLEYLNTYRVALKEIYRVLKPGGEAIITLPNRRSPYKVAERTTMPLMLLLYQMVKQNILGQKVASSSFSFKVRPCIPLHFDKELKEIGFKKVKSAFCNLAFFPMDKFCPNLSLIINKKFGFILKSKLFRWLGTQYIVKVVK